MFLILMAWKLGQILPHPKKSHSIWARFNLNKRHRVFVLSMYNVFLFQPHWRGKIVPKKVSWLLDRLPVVSTNGKAKHSYQYWFIVMSALCEDNVANDISVRSFLPIMKRRFLRKTFEFLLDGTSNLWFYITTFCKVQR